MLIIPSTTSIDLLPQTSRTLIPLIPPLKPHPLQKPKQLRTSRLPREMQPPHIRPQILMHLQGCSGGPIRIRSVGPGFHTPAGVHEGDGVGDVVRAEHGAEDGEDFGFGGGVELAFDAVGFVVQDGDA